MPGDIGLLEQIQQHLQNVRARKVNLMQYH
jgi:hypothetical protein